VGEGTGNDPPARKDPDCLGSQAARPWPNTGNPEMRFATDPPRSSGPQAKANFNKEEEMRTLQTLVALGGVCLLVVGCGRAEPVNTNETLSFIV